MKLLALVLVSVAAFCGMVLENSQEAPTPVRMTQVAKPIPPSAPRSYEQELEAHMQEMEEDLAYLKAAHRRADYLASPYDPGMLTGLSPSMRDLCGSCDGWGLKNPQRETPDTAPCDPCKGTGLSEVRRLIVEYPPAKVGTYRTASR
jgi:hypothetical protein